MIASANTEKTFLTHGGCPFIHDDISMLYGVPPMPLKELPKTCSCGAPLTYADTIWFVSSPQFEIEGGEK